MRPIEKLLLTGRHKPTTIIITIVVNVETTATVADIVTTITIVIPKIGPVMTIIIGMSIAPITGVMEGPEIATSITMPRAETERDHLILVLITKILAIIGPLVVLVVPPGLPRHLVVVKDARKTIPGVNALSWSGYHIAHFVRRKDMLLQNAPP